MLGEAEGGVQCEFTLRWVYAYGREGRKAV